MGESVDGDSVDGDCGDAGSAEAVCAAAGCARLAAGTSCPLGCQGVAGAAPGGMVGLGTGLLNDPITGT
jgi:hypothetical protein